MNFIKLFCFVIVLKEKLNYELQNYVMSAALIGQHNKQEVSTVVALNAVV